MLRRLLFLLIFAGSVWASCGVGAGRQAAIDCRPGLMRELPPVLIERWVPGRLPLLAWVMFSADGKLPLPVLLTLPPANGR